MAVLSNGDIRIYVTPGDGSALETNANTVRELLGSSLFDPNYTEVKPANNITIKQVVTMGHLPQDTAGDPTVQAFPDLFAVVDNAGSHQLWWFEHLDGIGNYQMPAIVLDSSINWSTKTISGTTRAGKPALVVRDKTTGQIDLYSTNCTVDCANINWFTNATKTVARPAASALSATNTPVITSSDTNNDTHPDLWSISATGAASYGAGTSTGTFAAPAAAGTVIPPVTANLRPMGAVNFRNPATNQDETHVYAANAAGQLLDYQKMTSGILGPPTIIGTAGWNAFTPFGIVDWNHDGYPDLLTRHDTFCTEDVFLGSATGFSTPAVNIGGGWCGYNILGIADWNHDGHFDIIAADSQGTEWMYPGDLTGGGGNRVQIGGGFHANTFTTMGITDWNLDGFQDLLVRYTPDGSIRIYYGDLTGGHLNDNGINIGSGFAGHTFWGMTNYNGDPTRPNLITREANTGNLRMFTGNGQGLWSDGVGIIIANGW